MTQLSMMRISEYFGLLTEDTFPKVGIYDSHITAYVAGVLTDFVAAERMYNPLWRTGVKVKTDNLVEMIKEANSQSGFLKAIVGQHIGDFALFMSGIFPENLERRGITPDFYAFQGKNSYRIASNYYGRIEPVIGSTFLTMANYFEKCIDGLNRIREEHLHIEQTDYDMLIVPKDRNALINMMLDTMNRWKKTRNQQDRRIALFYAERLGIGEDKLFDNML